MRDSVGKGIVVSRYDVDARLSRSRRDAVRNAYTDARHGAWCAANLWRDAFTARLMAKTCRELIAAFGVPMPRIVITPERRRAAQEQALAGWRAEVAV